MDSRRSGSVDEEAKVRHKHQILLQEFLVLQKECVSKKRKLKEAKERKETVLDEIRFLKRRRNFLLKVHSQNSERQQDGVQSQKLDSSYAAETSRRYLDASEAAFPNSQLAIGSMWNLGGVSKEVGLPPLRYGKKPKDLFANGKRVGKGGKVRWPLKV